MSQARRSDGAPRWVFVDIGNVIWPDDAGDRFTLENIGGEFAARGRPVGMAELEAAVARAVVSYAPSVWRAAVCSSASCRSRTAKSASS